MTFLDQVKVATDNLEHKADLISYAAKAALDELAINWRAAISDGTSPSELVGDIDEVIAALNRAKAQLCQPVQTYSVDMLFR
jgi:hypothetical protein